MSTQRRLLAALGLGSAILLLGVVTRQDALVILAVPFLWYAAGLLLSSRYLRRPALRVSRTLDTHHAREDEELRVNVDVQHRGAPIPMMAVIDELPRGVFLIDGEMSSISPIPQNGGCRLSYTLRAPRGAYEQAALQWVSWSPIGLAAVGGEISCRTNFSASPIIESLRTTEIHPRLVHAFTGPIRARLGGAGVEFFGCRTFCPGDDIRRINWSASARRESFILNEYELERMTDVHVILDVRASAHVEVGGSGTFDRAVRGAASLAAHYLAQGNRVGYLSYGDFLRWICPTTGRIQLERILRALASAKLAQQAAFEELRRIPTRLFAAGSQLIILSTLVHPEDMEVPAQLVARGYSVLLVYLNPLQMERSHAADGPGADIALRLLQLKRRSVASFLASAGVQTVDWDVTRPLSEALYAVSRRRGRWGRSR